MEKTGQWERVKKLFDVAVDLDPAERDRYLSQACGGDTSLRGEVESLLSAYGHADGLSQPMLGAAPPEVAEPPETIGAYRLIRKLGEGGMGQVWLAEQGEPLRRRVALKLIRSGLYDEALLRRFQHERQSLALMEHPAIAKVFDAGTTAQGQPYLVMEYVPGEPITAYCDLKKLAVRERLELFLQVCEGVQHAHQKAIIHRDLKPANILVVEVDGKPTPRIIDFGLARTATPRADGATVFTRVWGLVGTPGYMSPEQADPTAEDVDTRADVYALGVILYELLTGQLPFDTANWKKQPLDAALRELREQDAPRPSTRLTAAGKTSSAAAADMRSTTLKPLVNLLRGDLDSITLKAIEKDRTRRYASVGELAADVTRYLTHEPVVASPAGVGYRMGKYVQRHRVAVGVAAALVVLLSGFAVVEAVQLRRITEERNQIARERDRADRIADFMTSMFRIPDPSESRGNQVTAREILDKASADIGAGLARDPELQSQMMYVMGTVYDNLGLYSRAEALFTDSSGIGSPHGEQSLRSRASLGRALYHSGQYAKAVDDLRSTLAEDERVFGLRSRNTTEAMDDLGYALELEGGHYAESESLLRRAYDTERAILGPDDPDTLRTLSDLGLVLNLEGERPEAEQKLRQVLAGRMRVLGPQNLDTVISMNNLGIVLVYEAKYAEAESLFRQVLDWRTRVLGPDQSETMAAANNLAVVLRHEGRLSDSAALQEKALEFYRRAFGPENPKTFVMLDNLAETYAEMGDYAKAERMVKEARDVQLRLLPNDAGTAITTYNLAGIYAREGRRQETLLLARDAIDHGLPPLAELGMATDPDFKSLFGDPRFVALAAYAREKAAAQEHPAAARAASR
jgi:eukaryotic-like serine/threonine-protein kinase